MKFIIAFTDLQTLLKAAGITKQTINKPFTLSACAARVFVEFEGGVAGIEELVLSDGAVTLSAPKFLTLLGTYKGTRSLSFEGGPDGLKVQNFTMPILAWNPHPQPPAHFHIFPVNDLGVLPPPKA